MSQDGSDVSVEVAAEGAEGSSDAPKTTDNGAAAEVTIRSQPWCGRYAVPSQDFMAATVGAKSLNTVRLQVTLLACAGGCSGSRSQSPVHNKRSIHG